MMPNINYKMVETIIIIIRMSNKIKYRQRTHVAYVLDLYGLRLCDSFMGSVYSIGCAQQPVSTV